METLKRPARKIEGHINRRIKEPMCSVEEAMRFLGLKTTAYRKYCIEDPFTKVRKSFSVKGKVLTKSVEQEFERLHGIKINEI